MPFELQALDRAHPVRLHHHSAHSNVDLSFSRRLPGRVLCVLCDVHRAGTAGDVAYSPSPLNVRRTRSSMTPGAAFAVVFVMRVQSLRSFEQSVAVGRPLPFTLIRICVSRELGIAENMDDILPSSSMSIVIVAFVTAHLLCRGFDWLLWPFCGCDLRAMSGR